MSFLDDYVSERSKEDPTFKKEWEESRQQYEIARKVIAARKKLGLTQADLAELLKTKQSAISRIERGDMNITVETLTKLADTLKIEFTIKPHSKTKIV